MGPLSAPASQVDPRMHLPGVKDLFRRHPIASAVGVWAVYFCLTVVIVLASKRFFPGADPGLVGIAAQTVGLVVVLSFLGWWREAGYTHPRAWRELRLLWLPALVILVPPLVLGAKQLPSDVWVTLLIGYFLTGFTEEGFFRGLVLRLLMPTGRMRAAVISAVLFGSMHLVNLFIRSNPVLVLAQCVGAFADGVGFAALRLRTRTLWPLIGLHMLHDLLLKLTHLPAIPLDVAQVTILMIYGFYLLRSSKTGEAASAGADSAGIHGPAAI